MKEKNKDGFPHEQPPNIIPVTHHTDSSCDHFTNGHDLWQGCIVRRQARHRLEGESLHGGSLRGRVEVKRPQHVGYFFTFPFRKRKDDSRSQTFTIKVPDQRHPVGFRSLHLPSKLLRTSTTTLRCGFLSFLVLRLGRLEGSGGFLVSLFEKPTTSLHNFVELQPCPEIMRQWYGTVVGPNDMNRFAFRPSDPVGKLYSVGCRGGQEDHVHVLRKHDDDLFPYDSTLRIVHVVHLIEHDPFDVSN